MRRFRRRDRVDADLLRPLDLFRGCNDQELCALRSLMTPVYVTAGTTLVTENDVGREFFIIERGTAEVLRSGEPVAHLSAGQCFGEVALIDGEPRTATVRARSDMKVFVQDDREFSEMLRRSPTAARNIMRTMARRSRAA